MGKRGRERERKRRKWRVRQREECQKWEIIQFRGGQAL